MKSTPLVSIIIPTFNRTMYLEQAIESVLNQSYTNYEIIVVNDGSTIDVRSVLEPYMDKIHYIYQEHKNLAAARNTGIKHSKGKYLAFLDDDDLFESRKLEIQVPFLEKDPGLGCVYSDNYFFSTDNPAELHLYDVVEKYGDEKDFAELLFLNSNVCMPVCLIRRTCFEEVGLFDDTLSYHADGDLLLRIALKWNVCFSDYPSTRVRKHQQRKSANRLGINQALIQSAEKILRSHPDFQQRLGNKVNERLADIYFFLCRDYLKAERFTEAQEAGRAVLQYHSTRHLTVYLILLMLGCGPTASRFTVAIAQHGVVNTRKLLRFLKRNDSSA